MNRLREIFNLRGLVKGEVVAVMGPRSAGAAPGPAMVRIAVTRDSCRALGTSRRDRRRQAVAWRARRACRVSGAPGLACMVPDRGRGR